VPTSYRPYFPHQGLLLPSLLSEWLPEDHLAYFISDAVEAAVRTTTMGICRRN
jgi:hypothetical protein